MSADDPFRIIALRLDALNHAPGVPTGQEASNEKWELHQQLHGLLGLCPLHLHVCRMTDRKGLASWARLRAIQADQMSDTDLAIRMNLNHDGDRLREIADLLETE